MPRDGRRKVHEYQGRPPQLCSYSAEASVKLDCVAQLIGPHLAQLAVGGQLARVQLLLCHECQQLSLQVVKLRPIPSAKVV